MKMIFLQLKKIIPPLLFLLLFAAVAEQAYGQQMPGGFQLPAPGSTPVTKKSAQTGGKVIDDSTKTIYGPTTTYHFFEDDILNNRDSTRFSVDTLLPNFHRWTFLEKSWDRLVDLGNFGTATRPLFFQGRDEVGVRLGFNAYDPYSLRSDEVRYYDTKSPHTDMYYVIGGQGRNLLTFRFTQNIHPRLNFGFWLRRFNSEKQYGTYNSRGSEANLAQNWNFLIHSSYFSKNKKYLLLAHVRNSTHEAKEQGGLIPDSLNGTINRFNYEGAAKLNDNAHSRESRNAIHLYQQYRLLNGFQIFHQFDFRRTKNYYRDTSPTTGLASGIYPTPVGDTINFNQNIGYSLIENKVGLKGALSGFNYRASLKQRYHSMNAAYPVTDSLQSSFKVRKFENILGLWLDYYFRDSSYHLTAVGEHAIGRDFLLRGEIDMKWIKAGYKTAFVSPDLIMQQYRNSYFRWDNEFNLTGVNTLYGSVPLVTPKVEFIPEIQYHLITNHLYWDTLALPRQFGGSFSLLRLGSQFQFKLNRWNIRGMGYYSVSSNKEILRVPSFFFTGQVTFDFIYAKVLYVQLGVASTYRSTYLADAYMPVTQQFYNQNSQNVNGYAVADVFANLRIRQVRILLKLSHANQGFTVPGYFTTPTYLGLQRAFNFGVSWPLFD